MRLSTPGCGDAVDLRRVTQDDDRDEPFAAESSEPAVEAAAKPREVMADDRLVDDPRVRRAAFRARTTARRQVEDDRERREAGGGGPRRSARRADDSTLVASTTVSRPAARRLASSRWSRPNAARVARWSASSPETSGAKAIGRQDLVRGEVPCRERRLARLRPHRPGRPGSGRGCIDVTRDRRASPVPARRVGPRSRRLRPRGSRRPAGRRAAGPRRTRPSVSRNREPCHGHSRQPSTNVPSASGPPACAHTACMAWTVSATRTRTRSLIPALALVGVASGSVARSVTLAGVELDPFRAGAAERVPADHVAEQRRRRRPRQRRPP